MKHDLVSIWKIIKLTGSKNLTNNLLVDSFLFKIFKNKITLCLKALKSI